MIGRARSRLRPVAYAPDNRDTKKFSPRKSQRVQGQSEDFLRFSEEASTLAYVGAYRAMESHGRASSCIASLPIRANDGIHRLRWDCEYTTALRCFGDTTVLDEIQGDHEC